jgi:choline dehydrogenase
VSQNPDPNTSLGVALYFKYRATVETEAKFKPPAGSWTLLPSVVQPKSRRLTGPQPLDPIQIHDNLLSQPDDMKAMIFGIEICREIGNSAAASALRKTRSQAVQS